MVGVNRIRETEVEFKYDSRLIVLFSPHISVCVYGWTHTLRQSREDPIIPSSEFAAQMANHFIRMPIRCREGKHNLCVAERGGLVLMTFLQTALHSQN